MYLTLHNADDGRPVGETPETRNKTELTHGLRAEQRDDAGGCVTKSQLLWQEMF